MRAFIFDLDGVIVDTEPLQQRAFNQLLAQQGVNYQISDDDYGKFFVGVSVQENAQWLITNLGLRLTPDEIRAAHEAIYTQWIADSKNLIPMPGLLTLLDALKSRGLACGVATGSPREHARLVLGGLRINSHFRAVVTGSEISRPKPDPEIYLRAVTALNVDPRDAIALEDSAAGIMAAKTAGLRVIAVPNRYTLHHNLSRADARVENLGQVAGMML